MYCSSCGAEAARGVNYCNLCGAKLGGAQAGGAAEVSGLSPDGLVWAVVTVFVVGLGGLIGLLAVMKEVVHFPGEVILGVTAAVFLLMLATQFVLVRLLLRRTRVMKDAADAAPPKSAETKELGAARPAALPEHVPSVTEQTTRAFEPSYAERGAARR
jgi:hypothetical protein